MGNLRHAEVVDSTLAVARLQSWAALLVTGRSTVTSLPASSTTEPAVITILQFATSKIGSAAPHKAYLDLF